MIGGPVREISFRGHSLSFGKRTLVMGVLNVTPDSFSDGGLYQDPGRAIERGLEMEAEGADIIDVGGESTRPFSKRLSSKEELERILPVIEGLSKALKVPISVDTYKAGVARKAIEAGASIINDISALRFDPQMLEVVREERVPVIIMHMKGTPEDMQINPTYGDVVGEIKAFLRERADLLMLEGVDPGMIIVDPGIGFGKGLEHNLQILRDLGSFYDLGFPVLIGTSNKTFIGKILEKEPHEREAGTMATVAYGTIKGVDIVRVHSVKKAVETIKVIDAIRRGQESHV